VITYYITMFYDIFIFDFLRKHYLSLFFYLFIIFSNFPLESVALPRVYGILFDKIKTFKNEDLWDIQNNLTKMNFSGSVISVVIIWTIIIIAYGIKHHLESSLVPGYMNYIRKILYEHTINAFKEQYTDVKAGEYLSRMLELMRNAKDLFQYVIGGFVPYVISMLFSVAYLSYSDYNLGKILLTCLFIVCLICYYGGIYLIDKVGEREIYMNEVVNQGIQNSIDNLMNIYINNEADNDINKNKEVEDKGREMMTHIMFVQNVVITVSNAVVLFAYFASLYVLYTYLKKSKVSTAKIIAYILILGNVLSDAFDITSGYIHNMIYKLGIIDSAKPFMDQIFINKKERTAKNVIKKGDIQFKNIVFRYDKNSDEVLFDGLNLKLTGGTKIGVMGRSGSGKTTLMKMLVGLYKPEEGEILIDNVDINKMDIDYLRSQVNYVNQRTQLFEDTILYNMKYGNDITDEEIIEKLKRYKLDEVFSDLPGGVKANAGLNGGNLSGGMQKITILMRGILKGGSIVILDEPLAGLDKKTIAKTIDMVLAETQNKTLLVITHDNTILPYMDRVVDINNI
jgi:ABC-type multidrug transport system fused ATPase/permease subunit